MLEDTKSLKSKKSKKSNKTNKGSPVKNMNDSDLNRSSIFDGSQTNFNLGISNENTNMSNINTLSEKDKALKMFQMEEIKYERLLKEEPKLDISKLKFDKKCYPMINELGLADYDKVKNDKV